MSSQTGNPAQLQDVIDALARANCKPRKNGNGYTAFCPVHEADGHDHSPSLNFEAGKKADVVMKCHAGCDYHQIRAALGLEPAKLNGKRRIVDIYPYQDASGKAAFEKIRYEPKDFRIRHHDATGAEVWKQPRGIEPPLYRLPAVAAAIASGEPVYLVEGEKDADRLAAAGLCATTNYDGAAAGGQKPKWRASYTAALAGADLVLIPDNDEPGHAHMRHIAAQLAGVAKHVRCLELPELAAKGDVSDWFNAGHTIDELKALADSAPDAITQPQPEPTRVVVADHGADTDLANRFLTDLGNSERLVARYGNDLRYCFDFGKWLIWDGLRWKIDRDGAALDKAKATARAMLAEAATLGDKEDARKLAAWSFRSQSRDRMAAMLYLAQPDLSVRPEQLDTQPWLLNVQNGTLDLRTGILRKPDRADLLTKAAPVVYDPTAKCIEWLSFLNRIFAGEASIIRFIQKAAGYSLTGLDTEECFFTLYGIGLNGKSTLVETLSALLGTDYAQQATPELLMQKKQQRHPTELAVLRGARLVATVETGQGKRLNETLIKSMTGGDRIRANFMHQDTFEFRPEFKVWLSTNHKPVIAGTDLGIWRRIRLIPFLVTIPDEERDGTFKARLREPAALSGILNWAIEGALLWQREGLKPPTAVVEATRQYREEMDVLTAWLADCCFVGKLAEASAADLYRSYVQWREQNGERPETQTSFGLRLTERGFERKKRRNGWAWYGIGLLDCDRCDPCDPNFDIKEANSIDGFKKVENRVTPVTPVTSPSVDGLLSQHSELDARVAELIAAGWSEWNARAKADSERRCHPKQDSVAVLS